DGMSTEIDSRIRLTVDDINATAQSIADLNERIALAQANAGGQPPNDLLDQRDQMIQDLAGKIGVTTVAADDGSVNVYTGSGQALVLGQQFNALGVAVDPFGTGRLSVTFGGADVTGQVGGGELGGLIDTRRTVLDPARAQLGNLAAGLAAAVNEQHAQGVDATGQRGGDFFAMPVPRVAAAGTNTGTAEVSASIADVSALGTARYEMRFDGTDWQLLDATTGASVAMTGSGTTADPFVANGIEITVSGSAAAGDRFLVDPTSHAASDLRVAITDPAGIAAASAVRASASVANTGSARIGALTVTDAANADLQDAVQIVFTSATTYSVNGAGSYTYTPGEPIAVNGWSLSLEGAPATGDQFDVSAAVANSSDNGNARALAQLVSARVLNGGRDSITSAQTSLTTRVGAQARQAGVDRDSQASLLAQTQAARDSVSGVNLDEEAADLIRFQQAYQAAAQVIAVADTVFQSLLDAARR
ncbi:MAG TPA: flagellar basal body rod C-terminal domain-containing protein, partial [Nevskiaceae bacterium]|nr:flagellar basal body rod C-terminal domain-containing protein [Nevskiaceae bacterium]